MNDTVHFASALAGAILIVFLFRFYRRNVAPTLRQGHWLRVLGGLIVIGSSIALSIWLRDGP